MITDNEASKKYEDIFTEYIRSGIKTADTKSLGVEVEHFVLDKKTLKSVPYSGEGGVKEIIQRLMSLYPEAKPITGEDLLGFSTKDFNITLEPAAQIEISIIQSDDIRFIGSVYKDFYMRITEILAPMGLTLYTVGCQPVSHVDDLELIPKGRYRLMDEHFKKTGTGGREMMRGTASAQVSVDYTSEEDFRRKLQAAYFYTPLFKLLTDKVKNFQGVPVNMHLKRTDIWNRTDPTRCGILPDIFKKDYGFKDYARFLCTVPLILVPEAGGERYTGDAKAPEIFNGREIGMSDIEHIFSMPFPDVRVKRYLEIRGADSVPIEGVEAFCALVKGLLYSEKVLDHVQMLIAEKGLDESAIKTTENSLMKDGFEGELYGVPAGEFIKDTLKRCEEGLTEDERLALHGWGW